MSDAVVSKQEIFRTLPPEWPQELLPDICRTLEKSRIKLVILDDDPTGTQTVHNLSVLTVWDVDQLKIELQSPDKAFFILTNSRGLTREKAMALASEIGSNLKLASQHTQIPITLISRSDSTLRGHFPHEVDEMAKVTGETDLPYLICPFFLEGGRFTLQDIHYVAEGDRLVPAAQTSYAGDTAFGYQHSNLCQWVEEKTLGRVPADKVISISLDDLRTGGPEQVARILLKVPYKTACIVNAVSYKDIEVLVTGLLKARNQGKNFLFRTAASFARVMAGIVPKQMLLTAKELTSQTSTGGLFIVGSYVPKTTAQVAALIRCTDIFPIEIRVKNLLEDSSRSLEIKAAKAQMQKALTRGQDTLIYTSRTLVAGKDPKTSLEIGQAVSRSLVEMIQELDCQPRYLVAKGGITSSDIATQGLKVKKARILGQVLPGIPAWALGEESLYPGMAYIIFPGNVGDDTALVTLQQQLKTLTH